MIINKRILNKLGLTLWMAASVVMPNIGSAAPGDLATTPLFTQANADPNIMLHLDSSGSMNHVMVESSYGGVATYDAATTYDADSDDSIPDTCIDGLIPNTDNVYLAISSGNPKISFIAGGGGTLYDLGNDYDSSTGTGTERCFDPSLDYNARLTTYPTLPETLIYSGNYLNWYFNPDTTTGTWSTWSFSTTFTNYKKPQTRNRSDVAKASLTSLVNSLGNVRIGLSSFRYTTSPANWGLGASFDEEIDDIDSGTQRADVLTAIDDVVGHGGTPLAETLKDIGRYFSNEHDGSNTDCGGGNDLKLHPATTNDTEGCTDVLGDVAPAKNLTGPIQYQCQSNFVIMTTDGLSSHDVGQNSGSYDLIGSTPLKDYDLDCTTADVTAGTCTGVYDKKNGTTYTTNSEASDYLDDVAQALYEVDLRPDLDDAAGNEVTNNIRTYVVGFADESVANNQLLIDTANQGGGSFIYADNASNLKSALENATSSILNLIGSAAAVTFNSATLGTTSAVYLALFNSSSWSGDLVAYDLNDTTGAIASTSTWSAATSLDALADANSSRTILTYNGIRGIAFNDSSWPTDYQNPDVTSTSTDFSEAQLRDMLTNASYDFDLATGSDKTANETFGSEIIDYLRGDTSLEGSTFRSRTSIMGDVVHAGPVYVGTPELNWPDGTGATYDFPDGAEAYSIYKNNLSTDTNPGRADRPGVVYVGSNDGMLHGFATEAFGTYAAGDEVLAYAPLALFSTDAARGYHYLSENTYGHQYYVDLIPTISDYHDGTNWRTVLIGGLRGGGQAIYALDVTDPENFSETNASSIVKWEFTDADDADLGYTFSRPTVALMENGRWAVIVGNGYNADTSNGASGEAALFILFLDADLSDGTWDTTGASPDYKKISTGAGNSATPNGLSTPTLVDLDGDGMVDRAYAGDLLGNMWAFDLDGSTISGWKVADASGGTKEPLFIAGSNQPITVQPEVVYNTDGDNTTDAPNVLVLFGTGQYFADGDNTYSLGTPQGAQAFYGVWDKGTKNLVPSKLIPQTITETGSTRTVSSNNVDYTSATVFGWYISNMNLNSDGERVVTNPVVRGDIVYFNTSIPTDTTCSYGGTGWQMSIQYLTGANPENAVFDSSGDGIVDNNDTAYSGTEFIQGLPAAPSFLSERRYTPGTQTQTGDNIADDAVEKIAGAGTGRLSWEELSQ